MFDDILERCCGVFQESSKSEVQQNTTISHVNDLQQWIKVRPKDEANVLIYHFARQVQIALFQGRIGFYRQAHASLRLALELALSYLQFSANTLLLKEWELSRKDIVWGELADSDNGVISKRYIGGFASFLNETEISEIEQSMKSINTIYRELSEKIHGSARNLTIDLDNPTFDAALWNRTQELSLEIVQTFHICLAIRWLEQLDAYEKEMLTDIVQEHAGHLSGLRKYIGGQV